MVVKFTLENVFGNCRRNPRHFGAPGREESLELYSVLWSDWATSKQKVLRHGNRFADAIFRRERSDDRKCVCCSQMSINKKSGQKTFRRRFVSGSIFVSPCPQECYIESCNVFRRRRRRRRPQPLPLPLPLLLLLPPIIITILIVITDKS